MPQEEIKNIAGGQKTTLTGNEYLEISDTDAADESKFSTSMSLMLPFYGIIGSAGVDPLTDRSYSAGRLYDSTKTRIITNTAAFEKQHDLTWAAGSLAGGSFVGGLSASTEYYEFAIIKDSDGSIDFGSDTSITAANIPAGYTAYQFIDWFKTDGSSQIIQASTIEINYNLIEKHWATPLLDINLTNTLTTTRRLDAISVPTGFECDVQGHLYLYDAGSQFYAFVGYPGVSDVAVAGFDTSNNYRFNSASPYASLFRVVTNTSRQIAARASLATVDQYEFSVKSFKLKRF